MKSIAVVLLLALLAACGSPSAAPAAAPSAQPAQAAAGNGTGADWLTYQHDLARSGVAGGDPAAYDPPATRLAWETEPLDGAVYAQVLVLGSRAFAVTENDTVYALDAGSGQVAWKTHVGEPVPGRSLPCGNIDPVGITGTPAIDPSAGILYAVAFLQPAHHELFALDVAHGEVRFRQPIDPPGADPLTHLQRGALSLAGGSVYVPFGGRFGDCGAYHGWVLAASAADGSLRAVYQVPTRREGGIWAPAGAVVDASGDLLVATGNAGSGPAYDFGNAVVRLSPDLQVRDWFAPTDWAGLSLRDADLGSTGPTLVGGGLVFQVGKTGIGYLLRADHLGQVGGELFKASVCNGTGAYGGTASAAGMVYVPCRNGLVAVRVGERSFSVAWRGPAFNAGAATVTGGAVWTINGGDGTLTALSASDGTVLFQNTPASRAGPLPHFLSPAAGGGRIFASRGTTVAAFRAG